MHGSVREIERNGVIRRGAYQSLITTRLTQVAEYRVDDLARAAGTTVGNVRVYQDRDLLPPPEKRGRVAIYSEAHLGRLRIIRGLLERGYTFAQIHEMLTTWQTGRDLSDLLGLERALTDPWTDEVPERLPLAELMAEFGRYLTPEIFRRATHIGLVYREGNEVVIPSPRLLRTARELLAAGVPMRVVLDLAEAVQEQTDRLAKAYLDMVDRYVVPPRETGWTPSAEEVPEFTEVVNRLRPLAQVTASAFLARSMSKAMNDWIAERFGPALRQDYPGQR